MALTIYGMEISFGAQTSTWDDMTWSHSSVQKNANVPTLGPRFLVKFPRVGKAIEVKCPTYAQGPPLGLNIDRCINYSELFIVLRS